MENTNLRDEVEAGLRKIAFGGVADCVKLLLRGEELSERRIKGLDLYCAADLKRGANGITEIKFYDRLKALELLSSLEKGAGNAQAGLIEALRKSAQSRGADDD